MAFDYKTNIAAVVNALQDYNSATSSPNLSAGLTSSAEVLNENITANDPEVVNVRGDRLPAIFVRTGNAVEDFDEIGDARKEKIVTYDIISIYPKDGGWTAHASLTSNMEVLAQNIEDIFQAELDLSQTALFCNPVRTDFSPPFQIEGTWAKMLYIELEAHYLTT